MNEQLEAIRRAAQAELGRTPTVRPWWLDAMGLMLLNAFWGLGWSTLFTFHEQQHTGPLMRWLGAGGLVLVGLLGMLAAVRPGGRDLRRVLLVLSGATMLVLLAAGSDVDPGQPFLGGVGCGASELVASVVPLGASVWVLTRFAPDPVRTAVAGLAAGAGGLVTLHLHCMNGTLAHLVVFHLVPWVLVSVLAVALRRVLPSATWAP